MQELRCRYDARKSFYGKAKVKEISSGDYCKVELYSYGTLVAYIEYYYYNGECEKIAYTYLGKYSQTTTRHQKEFFKQNDLTEDEIKTLFKEGTLVKEW